jgi:hypothetical protein
VGDAPGVGAQVAVELAHCLEQFGWLVVGVELLQVDGDAVDGVHGADGVTVPEKPLQPFQVGGPR